jgi:hypothetical protein
MAFDYRGLDWGIASALGDDTALLSELHHALVVDAKAAADLLQRSRCDANWRVAAQRLRGLALSFGSTRLVKAAEMALNLAPGDPSSLKAVNRAIARLEAVPFPNR